MCQNAFYNHNKDTGITFHSMEHRGLVQRGNTLKVELMVRIDFIPINQNLKIKDSAEFVLNGAAVFQARASQIKNGHTNIYENLIFVRFFKRRPEVDDLTYSIKFSSNIFAITNKLFTSDDGTWHLIQEYKATEQKFFFDVAVNMDVVFNVNSFAPLHEDEELVDYELRGEDGAVRVHRAVLAVASPVLRRMLCGTWKETTEGHVDIPGTSRTTLQSLKNFVYLRTLPDTGLERLLLLASYYMMPDLEEKCIAKLIDSLTAQNACDILEFAAKNKITRLTLTVLESVQNGEKMVKHIREPADGASIFFCSKYRKRILRF